jgi:large subunit ribosomal protein L10
MDNPRPDKVAVVSEVRDRLDASEAAILTEYRGLSVAQLAGLRRALQEAGGEYKVYKNTLVKLAVSGGRHEALTPLLEGPTAIAFVSGEVSAVAKALRDYARTFPELVVKGGFHGDGVLSSQDLTALADLPPRDMLLAQLAGALAAPLRQLAGLMQALPRNLAYGISALVEERGGPPEPAAEAQPATDAEVPAEAQPTAEAQSTADVPADGAAEVTAAAEDPAAEAAEAVTEAAEAVTEPAEAVTEPAEAATEPAEAVTEAADAVTEPAESPETDPEA